MFFGYAVFLLGLMAWFLSGVYGRGSTGILHRGDAQVPDDKGEFPESVKVKTGKGWHVYMRYPGFAVFNDQKQEWNMDIRADGGYAVAPPSEHGSGRKYEWVEGHSIFDREPAEHVPWTIEYLKEHSTKSNKVKMEKPPKPLKTVAGTRSVDTLDQYAAILKKGAQQGNRNHSATKLIGHLLGKGNDENIAWEILKQWNGVKNHPPLDIQELKKIFDSIRDQERKKGKKEPEKKVIDVTKFLDTEKRIIAAYNEEYVKIPFATGGLLSIMQSKMNGGLIGGRTYVLGGKPSVSKTNMLNNMGDNVCLNGHPVIFFSLDDGVTELRYRTYSRFSGFDIEQFNNRLLSESDLKAILSSSDVTKIRNMKYVVQENIKIEDWPQIVKKVYALHQKTPVIFVDYLKKVKSENNRMDERLRVDEIMSSMTNIAKQYNLPIIVIAELSRESYKTGQNLSMSSFKESGNIEYEASWLGILTTVEEDDNIDLIVFKAKRGTGATGKIALKLDKSHMSVRDRIEATKANTVTQLKKVSQYD